MKLIDMKNAPEAEQKDTEPLKSGTGPSYPYGLQVGLRHEDLAKLGMGSLPKVGDTFHLHGHAVVTGTSHEEKQSGPPSRRVEMQIQKMALHKKGSDTSDAGSAKEAMDRALDNFDA
jgi:hypothetical protein